MKIGNIVTNGPYTPTEWVPGSHVTTKRNDNYWDAANVKEIGGAKFFVLEDQQAALKRYRAGEFDILTDFPTDQYEWMKKNLPEPGARVAQPRPLLLRHQFAEGPDRRQARAPGLVHGDQSRGHRPADPRHGRAATCSWSSAGHRQLRRAGLCFLEGPALQAESRGRQEAAGGSRFPAPTKPLTLELKYNTNDNHKRIAVAIAAMWKPLGVNVELVNAETKVHYDQLQRGDVQVGRASWLADYNDPDNFLNLLVSGVQMNYGRWSNPEYDKLIKDGNAETDPDEAGKELFKESRADRARRQRGDSDLLLRFQERGFAQDRRLRRQHQGHPPHPLASIKE